MQIGLLDNISTIHVQLTAVTFDLLCLAKKQTAKSVTKDRMQQDLNNSHLLPDLGTLPNSYTLAHTGGKVYHAIPLVSTERWSPPPTSGTSAGAGATLVYATMNPMVSATTDEFGVPISSGTARFISGTLHEVHANNLPLFPTSNPTSGTMTSRENPSGSGNPPLAYVTHPTLACEDAIWMGSQDGLFDKHEVSYT